MVVNYSEAGRLAGVSKQAIHNLKKKGKYSFFCYDKKSGNPGVDTDDPNWKVYCNRRTRNRKSVKEGKLGPVDNKSGGVDSSLLIRAVVETLNELYDLEDEQRDEVLTAIEIKYDEIKGRRK